MKYFKLRCVNLSPIPRRSSIFTCPSSCDRLQVCGVTHTPIRGQLSKGPAAPSPTCPEFCSFDRGHGEADGLIEVKQKRKNEVLHLPSKNRNPQRLYCPSLLRGHGNDTIHNTTPKKKGAPFIYMVSKELTHRGNPFREPF